MTTFKEIQKEQNRQYPRLPYRSTSVALARVNGWYIRDGFSHPSNGIQYIEVKEVLDGDFRDQGFVSP